jgi:hypothetical protein
MNKDTPYFSPPAGAEQLIVFKCPDKINFDSIKTEAKKLILKEGFGILKGNVDYDGILRGKWFDFNPGMTGLVIRQKGKKTMQMTCHCYSEHGQISNEVKIPDYKALYFNISIQGDCDESFIKKIIKYYQNNKNISGYYSQTYKMDKEIKRIDFSSVVFFKDKDFLLNNENTAIFCEELITITGFPKEECEKLQIETMAEILSESHCILTYDEISNIAVLHFYSCLGINSGRQTASELEKIFNLQPLNINIKEIVIDSKIAKKHKDIKFISREIKEEIFC